MPLVGLAPTDDAPAYLLWVVMRTPPDVRNGWIVGRTRSGWFEAPSFAPCAEICDESRPTDWTTFRGLPPVYERAGCRLFLVRGTTP